MAEARTSGPTGAPDRPVVFVGLMGSGKSTVGRRVATRLGLPFVDTDAEIERRSGRAIAEIFATDGEPAFRATETAVLAELLDGDEPRVIATGGGVVMADENRRVLAANAEVVWLRATPAVLLHRIRPDGSRPLLAGDARGNLERLAAERDPCYREVADHVIDVDMVDRKTVIARVLDALAPPDLSDLSDVPEPPGGNHVITVPVDLGDRSYDVLVGPGARHRLVDVLPPGTRRAAIVTQADIGIDLDPGCEHQVFTIGDGEEAKSLQTVEELCRGFARWGLTRADAVVAVGGGLVTDVAGFAAAVYHRGVPVVYVATTLLAQIDAAVGGKTGVNLPEGKNLVGAFWQPSVVLCDTEVLASLPPREFRSGLGELAKYHFLGGGELDSLPIDERVAACVRIKADVVASDEREGGRRAILNYGHTLGHALETTGSYDLRHGEAVAIGLVYAAELARLLGRIDDDRVAEHRRVVNAYDLPSTLPAGVDTDELVEAMSRDKKAIDGITFVLDGPDGVEVVTGVDRAVIDAAFELVR